MADPWQALIQNVSQPSSPSGSAAVANWQSLVKQYAPSNTMSHAANRSEKYNFVVDGLEKRGVPKTVAEGIAINAGDESNFKFGVNEKNPIVPGSKGGFGLLQWTGSRRRALQQYAAQKGTSPTDPETQLDFTVRELHGSERGAYRAMLNAKTPGEAAAVAVNDYLRPAKIYRERRTQKYLSMSTPQQPEQTASGWQGLIQMVNGNG